MTQGRRAILVPVLAVLTAFVVPGSDESMIGVEPAFIDFGTIEHGSKFGGAVTLRNVSQYDLDLVDVRFSCGCTSAQYATGTIAPGKRRVLKFQIDTMSGRNHTREAHLFPIVHLGEKAIEVPSIRIRYEIDGGITNESLTVAPRAIKLTSNLGADRPLRLVRITTGNFEALTISPCKGVEIHRVFSSNNYEYTALVSVDPSALEADASILITMDQTPVRVPIVSTLE